MKYLLDTCVLSEFVKAAPEAKVLAWINARAENDLYVAAMSLAELQRGVARLPASRRKTDLGNWLVQLQAGFADRILAFTSETAAYWGEMCARVEAGGRTMATFDSIIAATAVEHGLVLVTRNEHDFAAALPVVFSPWEIP
ncbi:MAG: type II toxin-antitoxin system VapC family toxin [Sulfuritalea sp.]|nr:type II toxin-antitoxin system VapC family toxin [Sulfuritalea sp.]MDP1983840.1 type II toxin-antitoxin system VapC family toxin [Sulfuritalea sp.]